MRSPVRIDIAIVNYHSASDIQGCLEAIGQWELGHIWLVDNSCNSTETAALEALARHHPQVRVLTASENLGFGRGCNLAFAQSTAEFLLLLNPDARIARTDVLLLAETLVQQPRLAAVSPKIYWNEQRSFVLPPAFPQTPWHSVALALASRSRSVARWGAQLDLDRASRQMALSHPFEVSFLAGSVMLLRRKAVLSAGGLFDPDYFMFFEDSDLSLRLRRAGYGLAMVPTASAVHEYRHKAFKAGMMAQSQQQFFRKQYPAFYWLSGNLARVAALARPVAPSDWFEVLAQPVTSASEFSALTGAGRVLAFSPSMLMVPAAFRPSFVEARCFDAHEWALLEPAAYTALIADTDAKGHSKWIYFERAVDSAALSF